MTAILRPAIMADAEIVGADMRPVDRAECILSSGLDGPEAVRRCIAVSTHALACHEGSPKEPFCVCGVAPYSPGVGCVWLLGTTRFDEHRKDLMALTAGFIRECHAHYPTLVIQVGEFNTKSIRYLKRFGFKPFPVMDIPGSPFIHLVRTAHV